MKTNKFLYGAAYYTEYMPYERTEEDFQLMKEAHMNVIRIAESTWSTWEPKDGVFDFSKLHHMLDLAAKYDLSVIVGTPTYAIPAWLANKHPDIMSFGKNGMELYGHRQLFDITNPDYRFYAERIIRKLMEEAASHPQVIGFQLDNETRSAGAASKATQELFVAQLKKKYPDIEEFNREFGLDYWSNRIAAWEDFPDIRGTINGSLSAAYKRFLRDCITEFLTWQAAIVREYMRSDQFITHNFDYAWCGYSYGIQPEVDQASAAKCMDIAGCDIYHKMQEQLDGSTIAFGGSVARSLKKDTYLVLETQSQGNTEWLPYPGQLRLSAYSHIANGAGGVMYWNWHSIHNAIESYWKGILSHDLMPHETYKELKEFREELLPVEAKLKNLQKHSEIGILADNASLTGLDEFPISESLNYNLILRWFFDCCHELNLECDILYKEDSFDQYKLLIIPALYSASDEVLLKIKEYVKRGGHILVSFKSAFADDELKIYSDAQPHILTECIGATYDMFTIPKEVMLKLQNDSEDAVSIPTQTVSNPQTDSEDAVTSNNSLYPVKEWMELLTPQGADVWAYYEHPFWGNYAAVTHNTYGAGTATYIGCYSEKDALKQVLSRLGRTIGLHMCKIAFPFIKRSGTNEEGHTIHFYFNYSSQPNSFTYDEADGTELLHGTPVTSGQSYTIDAWDLMIVEIC